MNDHKCKLPENIVANQGLWQCPICKMYWRQQRFMHPTGHSVDKDAKPNYKIKTLWNKE